MRQINLQKYLWVHFQLAIYSLVLEKLRTEGIYFNIIKPMLDFSKEPFLHLLKYPWDFCPWVRYMGCCNFDLHVLNHPCMLGIKRTWLWWMDFHMFPYIWFASIFTEKKNWSNLSYLALLRLALTLLVDTLPQFLQPSFPSFSLPSFHLWTLLSPDFTPPWLPSPYHND